MKNFLQLLIILFIGLPLFAMEQSTKDYTVIQKNFKQISDLNGLFTYIFADDSPKEVNTIKQVFINEGIEDAEQLKNFDINQLKDMFAEAGKVGEVVVHKINSLMAESDTYLKDVTFFKDKYLKDIPEYLIENDMYYKESEENTLKQMKSINQYKENAVKKLIHYQEQIYNYLLEVDSDFKESLSDVEWNLAENNDTLSKKDWYKIYHLMIAEIQKRQEKEKTKEIKDYLNTAYGFTLSLMLNVRYDTYNYIGYSFNRLYNYDISRAFADTVRNIKSNSTKDEIALMLDNLKNMYPTFSSIKPIFLFAEESVFEPKSLNYARSVGPFEIFSITIVPSFLHMENLTPWQALKHDYNHYSDTIYDFYIDSKLSLEDYSKFLRKFQTYFYNVIENSHAFPLVREKILAHYVLMYVFREMAMVTMSGEEFIKNSINPKQFIHYIEEYAAKEHRRALNAFINPNQTRRVAVKDSYNNFLAIVKFFPAIEKDLLVPKKIAESSQSVLINLGFDISKTFAFHDMLISWFCDKSKEVSTTNSWEQFYTNHNH